jgi:hypothetical protein
MKPTAVFLFAAIFLGFLAPLSAVEQAEPTIADVLKELIRTMPGSIAGWERIQGKNDAFGDLRIIAAVDKSNFELAAKIIDQQTDYRCLIGKGYFIILPKEAGLPAGGGLANRKVAFPSATGMNSVEYLRLIKATKEADAFSFGGGLFYSASDVVGTISMTAGRDPLYVVLNKIARKLNAPCWIVADCVIYDPKTLQPVLPTRFRCGGVEFHDSAEHVPYEH